MTMTRAATPPSPGLWAVILGGTGFVAGFLGPVLVNPDANQGPLLGIFITGPGGAVAGLVLGGLVRSTGVPGPRQWQALWAAAGLLTLATLYYSLPAPAWRGDIIEAEVLACLAPAALMQDAIDHWETRLAEATWATPRPGWKAGLPEMLRAEPGMVLEMNVIRRARVYERRRPWNRGELFAGDVERADQVKRYFARDVGGHCEGYLGRPAALYFPQADRARDGNWPPRRLANFLSLTVIGPVPANLRRPALG